MNREQKIVVAKDFISLHKNNSVSYWPPFGIDDNDKYLTIFNNLCGGQYGECRDNGEVDDEGNTVTEPTEFEIEIGGFDSKSGNPIIFNW